MAYTSENHDTFCIRMQRLMQRFQAAREEALKLNAIYVNETTSGTDPEFTDHSIALKTELQDAVTFCTDIEKFVDNQVVPQEDREQWMTPFLQTE
jgi:hypothetical protein